MRAAKEHVTAGDVFQVVLSQRFDLDVARRRPLRRLPGPATGQPEPLPLLPRASREVTVVGASPEPMVRLRDGTVISRAHRRLATAWDDPRGGLATRRGAGRGPEGGGRARDAGGPGPQRRRAGGRASAPRWSTSVMVVERYSHIMHLTSQVSGRLAAGKGPIDVLRATLPGGDAVGRAEGAGHGDHRRPRAHQARRLRRGGRLSRLLGQPRHRHRHPHHDGGPRRQRLGAGGCGHRGRQRSRDRRTPSARTRPRRSARRWPWPGSPGVAVGP